MYKGQEYTKPLKNKSRQGIVLERWNAVLQEDAQKQSLLSPPTLEDDGRSCVFVLCSFSGLCLHYFRMKDNKEEKKS